MRKVLLLTILLLAAGLAPPPATAGAREETFLVGYEEGAHAQDLARRAGGTLLDDLPALGLALVEAAPGAARDLERDPQVRSVEPEGRVTLAGAVWNGAVWNGAVWNGAVWNGAVWNGAVWNGAQGTAGWEPEEGPAPPWGHFAIRAPEAWTEGLHPHARKVCLVDTGVDAEHPALAPNLAAAWNAIEPGGSPHDDAGHGTHLAGIVGAVHDGAWPVPGVAQPLLLSAKALDADGTGRTGDVLRGLSWCAAQEADVVLLAFTEDEPTRAFRDAVARLQRDGILVVASSGNGACGRCVGAPASLPGVLGVGAFGPDGEPAAFSSMGPEVDLLAPGALVTSAYPGGALRTGSGTSQAAAFVAGAAALAWSHAPSWSARHVAAHLERTADEGRLDVAEAVASLREAGR